MTLPEPKASPQPLSEFEYVCEQVENLYGKGCDNLLPPVLIVSTIMELDCFRQLYGVYIPGERYIFVHPLASRKTVLHEMTHYVLINAGLENDRCRHEEVSRYVAGQEDPNWRARYGCQKDDDG